nr:hypothetical protein GCM10020185_06080 [Pseudomonas brassicacearum subsp. brassicacearum]
MLALALPIMVAQLATTAMGFVDAVMAGRVGPRDLAAVALGNSIWVPVFLLMTGTLLATTPKVAQRFGAGTFDEIGPLVRQALWLALVVGLIATLALFSAEPILHIMNVDPELIGPCMEYLRGIGTGLPAVALYHVLRCFSDGLGRTRPAMVLGLCGLALNIPLNYIFIYGHLGVPAMGGVGCGWATAIVMWVMALGMAGWARWAPAYQSSRLFSRFDWPQWAVIKRLLGIGLPIGIAVFAESSIFAVIALLIGSLGATVVAGHQIALNFSSLVFMIPYSLGMAVTVRVGQALGRRQPREARFAAGVGMGTALAYACLSASLMFALRGPIAAIYTADPVVIDVASMLIVYAALFQFFRCDPGHGGRRVARLPGHPGNDDPDPVRLLGHRPAGGLRPGPDRLARCRQRPERIVARPDRGLELRGADAVDPPGTQRAKQIRISRSTD